MATDKPRFSVSMSIEMLQDVEQFRKKNNIATKSKAVVRLAELGLESLKKDALPIQNKANEIMKVYDRLDAHGQRMVEFVAAEEKARLDDNQSQAGKKRASFTISKSGPTLSVSEHDENNIQFAAYGEAKKEFSEDDIDDIKKAMKAKAERDRKKKAGE